MELHELHIALVGIVLHVSIVMIIHITNIIKLNKKDIPLTLSRIEIGVAPTQL